MRSIQTVQSVTRGKARRVWISGHGLSFMNDDADLHTPNETGGVLLGYWDGSDPVVTHVVGPGPAAQHQSDAYMPDYAYHEREIARLYAMSRPTLHYLGDWHTHPKVAAYLSCRDMRALRRIATYRPARVRQPIMLILGFGPQWVPKAWQGTMTGVFPCCRRLTIAELEVKLFDRSE